MSTTALVKPWPTPNWLGVNEYGTPINFFVCRVCLHVITLCPVTNLDRWGYECLGVTCPSYDRSRDADRLFDQGKVMREPVASIPDVVDR